MTTPSHELSLSDRDRSSAVSNIGIKERRIGSVTILSADGEIRIGLRFGGSSVSLPSAIDSLLEQGTRTGRAGLDLRCGDQEWGAVQAFQSDTNAPRVDDDHKAPDRLRRLQNRIPSHRQLRGRHAGYSGRGGFRPEYEHPNGELSERLLTQ